MCCELICIYVHGYYITVQIAESFFLSLLSGKQVYSGIEGLERSLGLDPSDPIVPFVLFIGTTSTIWY